MTLYIATRGHRDRDRAEQHGDQARERQEPPSAVGRGLDLRARLADIEQSFAALARTIEPFFEVGDRFRLAREQHGLARARAGLQQLRGLEIVTVHQHRGCELGETAALIGTGDEHAADTQAQLTHGQRCADLAAERGEQFRVRPDLAPRWPGGHRDRRAEGGPRDADLTAQRVAIADEANIGELGRLAHLRHAQHRGRARDGEASAPRLGLVGIPDGAR